MDMHGSRVARAPARGTSLRLVRPRSCSSPRADAAAVLLRARRRLRSSSGMPVRTRACRARVSGDGSGRRRAPRRSRWLPCFARGHDLARGVAGAADGCSVCLLSLSATDCPEDMAPKRTRNDEQLAALAESRKKRHRRVGTTSSTAAADGGDEESEGCVQCAGSAPIGASPNWRDTTYSVSRSMMSASPLYADASGWGWHR